MSSFVEYDQYDGLGLAELVRSKQVSPIELVEEAIRRIELHNPKLNAVVYKMYDQARQVAKGSLPEGPFTGVPFLVKDLMATVAGTPTGSGTRLLKDIPMPADSELIRRFRAAGVVIVGKTNAPEFGITPWTEPVSTGPAHNPWNLERTPGGSSGGSGAAVGARLVPIASGADGGGSIRIPASCNGIFGIKPSRGRTPTGPVIGEAWQGFSIEHVLTVSVRDSAAMLDATEGVDPGAPYFPPPKERPFLEETRLAPRRLRIAYTDKPFLGDFVDEECKAGLRTAVQLLESLGHELHEDAPTIDRHAFAMDFTTILMGETRADIEWVTGLAKCKPSASDFEPVTYALGLLGKVFKASDYANAKRNLQMTCRKIGQFFERYDVLLTPTLATPPFIIGARQPSSFESGAMKIIGALNAGWIIPLLGIVEPIANKSFEFIPFTPPFNVTGQPAMSVPLHWTPEGLPVGMQFAARLGDDATLFRLAAQLEQARPWADKKPAGF
jgi:amidase